MKMKLYLIAGMLIFPVLAQAEPLADAVAVADQKFHRVTLKDAQDAVARALEEKGAGDKVKATIIGRRADMPLYAYDRPLEVQVKTLDFNDTSGKWSANLMFSSGEEVLSATAVSGRYEEVYEVPVVSERLREGEVITAEMIDWLEVPASRFRKDIVVDDKVLVGKSPRRIISANRPIRQDELKNPAIMRKGAVVTMRYVQGGMEIRTSGTALDDGAEGDSIRVRNENSKVSVQGKIESADSVRVIGLADSEHATAELE